MPSILLASAVLTWLLQLGLVFGILLFSIGALLAAIEAMSFTLGSQRVFIWLNLLVRLPNGAMVVPALLAIRFRGFASLEHMLGAQFAVTCLAVLVGYAVLRRRVPNDSIRIGLRARFQGISLLAIQSSTIIVDRGLITIAGLLVAPAEIATLSAIAILLRPMQLLRNVLG